MSMEKLRMARKKRRLSAKASHPGKGMDQIQEEKVQSSFMRDEIEMGEKKLDKLKGLRPSKKKK